jgi:predicted hotdog family 3-hydroxylacyl-ACP dehydratase
MCLLDEVLAWDTERIRCVGRSHRTPDNPLRARGRLGIAGGIEYAAQTMAVHGALVAARSPGAASGTPVAGYLAGVRNVRPHVHRLDDLRDDLVCDAVRAAGDRLSALYDFTLSAGGTPLLTGRATVILDAGSRLGP